MEIIQFASYTLQGQKFLSHYRDFDALIKKFLESRPGVFIPNIPPKKVLVSAGKDTVDLRKEMIKGIIFTKFK